METISTTRGERSGRGRANGRGEPFFFCRGTRNRVGGHMLIADCGQFIFSLDIVEEWEYKLKFPLGPNRGPDGLKIP